MNSENSKTSHPQLLYLALPIQKFKEEGQICFNIKS